MLLQYTTLIFVPIYLFYMLPVTNNKPFYFSWTLVIFYLFKCCYWGFSALQLRRGYPVVINERRMPKELRIYHSLSSMSEFQGGLLVSLSNS